MVSLKQADLLVLSSTLTLVPILQAQVALRASKGCLTQAGTIDDILPLDSALENSLCTKANNVAPRLPKREKQACIC